jgi:2-methylisocitrate lyase-like PEP mutase family enzyme
MLEALGFKALATTSSGFAFTLGRRDGDVSPEQMMAHVSNLAAVTDLPISVDMENGYGADPGSAASAVNLAAKAGAVGGSIEDWDRSGHLYALDHAAERIAAAIGLWLGSRRDPRP